MWKTQKQAILNAFQERGLAGLERWNPDKTLYHVYVFVEEMLDFLYALGLDLNKEDSGGYTPIEWCCYMSAAAPTLDWFLRHGAKHADVALSLYIFTWSQSPAAIMPINYAGSGMHAFFKRGVVKRFTWKNFPKWVKTVFGPLESLLLMATPLTISKLKKPLWNLDILRLLRKYIRE